MMTMSRRSQAEPDVEISPPWRRSRGCPMRTTFSNRFPDTRPNVYFSSW